MHLPNGRQVDAGRSCGGGFVDPACGVGISLHLECFSKTAPGFVPFDHRDDILLTQ
jgi:hypothetical protein